jgi:hypothetical protein
MLLRINILHTIYERRIFHDIRTSVTALETRKVFAVGHFPLKVDILNLDLWLKIPNIVVTFLVSELQCPYIIVKTRTSTDGIRL